MQEKRLAVRCECVGKVHKASDLAKHLRVADFKARTFDFFDNIYRGNVPSTLSAEACGACNGTGYVLVNNGPDDVDKEPCSECSGTGRVVANN